MVSHEDICLIRNKQMAKSSVVIHVIHVYLIGSYLSGCFLLAGCSQHAAISVGSWLSGHLFHSYNYIYGNNIG